MKKKPLKQIIKWLKDSKDASRSKYVVHDIARQIRTNHYGKPTWNTPVVPSFVPASLERIKLFKPRIFNALLTRRDHEIAASGFVWAVSLFEAIMKHTLEQEEIKPSKKYYDIDDFASFLRKDVIDDQEEKILRLVKKYRNCLVHDGGVAPKELITDFKKIKGKRPLFANGILVPNLHDIEPWHDLIINITERVVKKYNLGR